MTRILHDREAPIRLLVKRAQELVNCATRPADKKRAAKLLAALLKQTPDLAPKGETDDGTE
jgi:hypothetical protein